MRSGVEGGKKKRALRTTGFAEGGTDVIADSVTRLHSSYHDVTVIQLEAVEHPRCRRQQGAYGQREGQALHIASLNHFHLQRKTKGRWR